MAFGNGHAAGSRKICTSAAGTEPEDGEIARLTEFEGVDPSTARVTAK